MTTSVFSLNRFEYEGRHTYYIPRDIGDRFEKRKPAFLIGSRGTGKTTLLMSLHWRERLTNKSLQRQLGDRLRSSQMIGCYLKMPDSRIAAIEQIRRLVTENTYQAVVSTYIECLAIEVMLDAVVGISDRAVVETNPDKEARTAVAIVESISDCIALSAPGGDRPRTLRHAQRACAAMRRRIERAAIECSDSSVKATPYSSESTGVLSRKVAKLLLDHLRNEGVLDGDYFFKICLDEAECIPTDQVKVLNSMIRTSDSSLFLVASFVREPSALTETTSPELFVSQADRDIVRLDKQNDKDFANFCEGITNARIQEYYSDAPAAFSIKDTLGSYSINDLLTAALSGDIGADARALLDRCRAFQGSTARTAGNVHSDEPLPIYETYLSEKLGVSESPRGAPKWKRRLEDSATRRKWMVAAYLAICSEYRRTVVYASASVLLQLCDKSVRDFLSFMESALPDYPRLIGGPLAQPLSIQTQNAAFRGVSRTKFESIGVNGVSEPAPTRRLVKMVGSLTRIVQTQGKQHSNIRVSERGLFRISANSEVQRRFPAVFRVLRDGASAGYIVLIEHSADWWYFRLHTSLAPHFETSYRGAYYISKVEVDDIAKGVALDSDDELDKLISAIGRRLAAIDDDAPGLFDGDQQ
jgi:hypothetical protein